ncbi:diguanylate cyclase [Billgrantia azerbaijanica]|nr:diguanylate cyclase [Halomonas azerbaijanica]
MRRWQAGGALWLLLCLATPLPAAETLTLGVFAYRPATVMQAHYQPLADYLSEQLPGAEVRLRVLALDDIETAIAQRQLDLLMTNPSHYVLVRSRSSLSGALATLIRQEGAQAVRSLGGVIITAAQRDDIATLADLAGRRIGIPGTRFLGGYQTQAFELQQAGLRLGRDAETVALGSHDRVVAAVLAGEVDAGFVRTGILESLAAEGYLDPAAVKVINPQRLADFPFQASTRLYPEWPFIALPQVPRERVQQLAIALFSLDPSHPAAQAAGLAGFSPPLDYLVVENLARELRLPPFDRAPALTWGDVWTQYRDFLLGLAVASGVVILLLFMLARRNRLLRRQHHRLRLLASVFSHAQEGVMIITPQGEIVDVNAAFTQITGYPRDEAIGQHARRLSASEQDRDFLRALEQRLDRDGCWEGEVWNRRRNGERYPQRLTISAVHDEAGRLERHVCLLSDITELKAHQQRLEQEAHHDALTGLPNRQRFSDRLHQAIAQSRRHGNRLAVVFLDLDGFKAVNDTYGHDVGDQLLAGLAGRMQRALREGDTLARLGGDEFVALLRDLHDEAAGLAVVKRLLAVAADPIVIDERRLQVSASLGVAFALRPRELDAARLLHRADQAMYQAKRAGRNRFCVSREAIMAPCTGPSPTPEESPLG